MLERVSVRNVVLFVGDAVRYASAVDHLSSLGPTYKTVAASLHTPASFGSLLTGLNVPQHGITGFRNVLPESTMSLLDVPDVQTAFSPKTGTMHADLHRIFRTRERTPLWEIQPPFIWIVRDPGGHAPYDGYDPETYNQQSETGGEYLRRMAGREGELRADYAHAVDNSVTRFERAIDTINERGLSDETLLIYTSDHGELLGEYGLIGHNHIACPELVHVPTTFVHTTLEPGDEAEWLRHVDVVPTLLKAIGKEFEADLNGSTLDTGAPEFGYNHFEMSFYNTPLAKRVENLIRSCWDGDGGHVFVQNSPVESLVIYAGLLFASHNGRQMIRSDNLTEPLRKLLSSHERFGDPGFSEEAARAFIETVGDPDANRIPLDEDTKDRLDDLGYV
jgi:hypothetical protein